jgi:hypothetical protein
VEPDFLQKVVAQFYVQNKDGEWVTKDKAAFMQTPQDFFNVSVNKEAHIRGRTSCHMC